MARPVTRFPLASSPQTGGVSCASSPTNGSPMRVEGKVAIVTGAGQGIGAASATRLAEEGAAVTCADVNGDAARQTAETIRANGGRAIGVAADVADDDGNRRIVEETLGSFGALDILHANAGVQLMARLEETSLEDWDRLHSTNLRGIFLGIRHALPLMRRRGGGAVIITSSLLGIVGDVDMPAYGATKGALRAMARSLAAAHGPENIRFNTICPGDVDTPLNIEFLEAQADPEAARREITERYPLRRFASPRDVANVVLFLASDDAAYITGTDIIVDGGLLARIY